MKMMYVSCNISSLSPLLEIFKQENITSFQMIEEATGQFPKGEPRLNTPIWPGLNSIVFVTCNENQCHAVKKHINQFNKVAYNDNELIFVNSWTIDEDI